MQRSASGSSTEFYDAVDDVNAESGIWPSFSSIPSTSAKLVRPQELPFLPIPPGGGTPRLTSLRNHQQQRYRDQCLSDNSPRFSPLHQQDVFARKSSITADDQSVGRRKKLEELRARLLSFDIDRNSETSKAGAKQGFSSADNASSGSDRSSLASWSKNLLNNTQSASANNDRLSDQSDQKNTVNKSGKASAKSSNFVSPVSDFSGSLAPKLNSSPITAALNNVSSSTSSSHSSKSNTLERLESQQLPQHKFCSERQLSTSTRSSKSNSLPREIGGLSSCGPQYLYDECELAALARKNSAAAEVIEALTSEIVRKAEIERENYQRASADTVIGIEQPLPDAVDATKPESSKSLPLGRWPSASVGYGGRFDVSKVPPDIVSSNRIKSLTLDSVSARALAAAVASANRSEKSILPLKPSRSRRRPEDPKVKLSMSANVIAVDDALKDSATSTSFSGASTMVGSSSACNIDKEVMTPIVQPDSVENASPESKVAPTMCMNPLALHIMKITADYPTSGSDRRADSDNVSVSSSDVASLSSVSTRDSTAIKQATRFKKMFSKQIDRARDGLKQVKDQVARHWQKEESSQSDDEDNSESSKQIRVRASHHHKGPYHFDQVKLVQDLSGEHAGSIWCIKFSHCGRLMATAGQDKDIRVWVIKDALHYFNTMRMKYATDDNASLTCSMLATAPLDHHRSTSSLSVSSYSEIRRSHSSAELDRNSDTVSLCSSIPTAGHDDALAPFAPKPFCILKGHNSDVLDMCWSKNFFLLTSSMDRTVRLWHISRTECLCCFQHIEFVTAIAFLPKDDRYFLSGSLDGKLRLWHIPEKKVALWNEVDGGKLITALTFVKDGKFAVVGTIDGRCIFYTTEQLKYHTQIDVKSSHGKNSRAHKVAGLEGFQEKLLVTSNDSRIRLYDIKDMSLTCKYKGYTNYGAQIRAGFSHDGKYIVCGSEDKNIYLWKTNIDSDMLSISVRKDRNQRWERIRAHNAVVTAAVFSPRPNVMFQQVERTKSKNAGEAKDMLRSPGSKPPSAISGEVLVSADMNGTVYVFFNKPKVKAGGSVFMPSY